MFFFFFLNLYTLYNMMTECLNVIFLSSTIDMPFIIRIPKKTNYWIVIKCMTFKIDIIGYNNIVTYRSIRYDICIIIELLNGLETIIIHYN